MTAPLHPMAGVFSTLGIAPTDFWIAIRPRHIISTADPVTYFDWEAPGNQHGYFTLPPSQLKLWHGFTFNLIGITTNRGPTPDDDWPMWVVVLPDDTGLIIQVRWLQIPAADGASAQLTYLPGQPTMRTRMLPGPGKLTTRGPDAAPLKKAYRLLDQLPGPSGAGRKAPSQKNARSRLLVLAELADSDDNPIDVTTLANYAIKSQRTIGYWLEHANWEIEDVRVHLRARKRRRAASNLN